MAIIGVSKPFFAKYAANEGTASYSDGGSLGRMQSVNVTINTSDDNDLYLDNALAESEKTFSDGELTIATDAMSQEVSAAILGVALKELGTIAGITDEGVKEMIFDDDQNIPDLGVGFIIKKRIKGVTSWRAVVLTKVKFAVPSDAATTQGDTIDWQVPELSGSIMRDDSEKHMWKREATFTTEAQAVTYIKDRLSITA